MTTATATRTRKPRPTIGDKAEMLLANACTWLRCRDRHTGRIVAYGVPSLTEPGKYHLTNGQQCDCKAGQAGRECCHRTAAARYVAQRKEEAAAAAALAAALLADDAASFVAWLDAVDRAALAGADVIDQDAAAVVGVTA